MLVRLARYVRPALNYVSTTNPQTHCFLTGFGYEHTKVTKFTNHCQANFGQMFGHLKKSFKGVVLQFVMLK